MDGKSQDEIFDGCLYVVCRFQECYGFCCLEEVLRTELSSFSKAGKHVDVCFEVVGQELEKDWATVIQLHDSRWWVGGMSIVGDFGRCLIDDPEGE